MKTLNPTAVQNLCRTALAEDIGAGDATTLAVVPENLEVTARLLAKQDCVCAGLPVAEAVFKELSKAVVFESVKQDGDFCAKGTVLARVTGPARAILTGERTALNFLQRISGIATLAKQYVDAVGSNSKTKILDTRKTTPGLRMLEKYAVAMGGAENHRFGLYDRVMIKDNHRMLAAIDGPFGITRAVKACREKYPDLEVEVEADSIEEVEEAVEAGADYILLDNMTDEEMVEAVELVAGRSLLEASGGITLERIADLAKIGVDYISVGALTHSAAAVDISLDIQMPS
jgi:nicotinate-nucleotide pyrophosphorylase (carboxylating)